jgi:hypothetical protein
MRRVLVVGVILGLLSIGLIGTAVASPDHNTPFEPHAHVLVLGVVVDESGEPVSIRKCVDLAANTALPLNAHHVHVHFGQAGEALSQSGNVVVPVAPFPAPFDEPVPWSDCESLLDFFGL